jgi:hypothetical protein
VAGVPFGEARGPSSPRPSRPWHWMQLCWKSSLPQSTESFVDGTGLPSVALVGDDGGVREQRRSGVGERTRGTRSDARTPRDAVVARAMGVEGC